MTGDFSFPLILGYLLPIGFFLLAWGGMEPERARRAAIQGLVALALATVGYFATGFAFHLGGAAVFSDRPGLDTLDSIWSPLDRVRGLGWGVIGLKGFFLGGADTPQALALFAAYLPMAATAVLLPMMALFGRARGGWVALLGLLTGALLFPLAACWVWGGGWLASMGQTLARGHGAVDHAGSGVVYLLGGMMAWGALTALGREPPQEGPAEMPPAHFPLLANLGVLLVVVGWLGWSLSGPLHADGARLDAGRIAVNGSLALAGATLTSLFYCWLALGRGDSLMVARGAAGGLVALSAGAPFLPPWAALVVGGVAGLLVPLGVYLVDRLLRLADATGIGGNGGPSRTLGTAGGGPLRRRALGAGVERRRRRGLPDGDRAGGQRFPGGSGIPRRRPGSDGGPGGGGGGHWPSGLRGGLDDYGCYPSAAVRAPMGVGGAAAALRAAAAPFLIRAQKQARGGLRPISPTVNRRA
jgi:Amt family ammonium transporter